ncbi:MAG TPA: response regulator [Armatimonadota bacterium]|nr:response regulator [Armatimonadota bacterium]
MPKILVIDDEVDLLQLVKFRLEQEGWEVVTAQDGIAGLDAAVESQPDLIFLDIMMPQMDGFAFVERLRTTRGVHRTPVVMLTAKSTAMDIQRARDLYVQNYITKPFDPEKLVTTAKKLLKL